MRTLLRHIASGQYFQSLEKWTPDRQEAYDFGIIARAMNFAQKSHLHDAELVLSFDEPGEITAIPLEKFRLGLARARRREMPPLKANGHGSVSLLEALGSGTRSRWRQEAPCRHRARRTGKAAHATGK